MGKHFFYTKLAWSNIKNNRRFYLPYILSSIGMIMMFYIISALIPGIDQNKLYGGGAVAEVLKIGVYVIGIFSVFFIFYINSFIIKRRKKELGLYNILGMGKKHIAKIILLETTIILLVNIILGIVLGILFSKLMFMLRGKILGTSFPIYFVIPRQSVLTTAGIFSLLFLATLLYNLIQIIRAKPIELLHGGAVGEKEPKANWLLALFGVACLGVGYYLSLTIDHPVQALMMFFVAVVLVIFGTYALFVSGMTAILKLLKRRKKFYYKSRNFTTVSGMLYRMKQNAAGLASICILSTCVLVMISSSFSMYISYEDILYTRYPTNLSIAGFGIPQEQADEAEAIIERSIQRAGAAAENISISHTLAFQASGSDGQYTPVDDNFVIFSASTLDRYNLSHMDQLEAKENTIYLQQSGAEYGQSTITFGGLTYNVIELEGAVEAADVQMGDIFEIVVPDMNVLKQIYLEIVPGSDPQEIENSMNYTYNCDVDLDDAAIDTLVNEMNQELHTLSSSPHAKSREAQRTELLSVYGGIFFLGILLGVVFIMALVLIIYYKQISEGYDDKTRFEIMQKVGMSHHEVRKSIHRQIMLVFFMPLLLAIIHLAFAMPMLINILALMNMTNQSLILLTSGGVIVLFAVLYTIVYFITARTYYKIIES